MNNDFSWLDDLEKEINGRKTQQVHLTVTLVTTLTGDEHTIIFQGYDKDLKLSEITYPVSCKVFVGAFDYLNTLAASLELDKRLTEEGQ